jgi:hypothetical protein
LSQIHYDSRPFVYLDVLGPAELVFSENWTIPLSFQGVSKNWR